MRTALAGVLVALALSWAPPVHACSCVPPRLARRVLPADGATGFPTDGAIRVFLEAFDPSVRAGLHAEYRLRDASGALVPLRADVVRTRLDLRPRRPLAPSTRYTLEQVFAYASSGERLSDTQRARHRGPVRGAWFPVVTFTTGAGPAPNHQRAPGVANARLSFRYGGGDCGPGISVFAEIAPPPGSAATDVVDLEVRGQGTVATAPAEGVERLYAGNMLCNPDPVTVAYAPGMTVRAVMRDAAGHELGASPWITPAVPGGAVPPSSGRQHGVGPSSWAPARIESVSTPASQGPIGCEHGFEEVSRRAVTSQHAPWMYGARSTIASHGGTSWLAFAGGDGAVPIRLVRATAAGAPTVLQTPLTGHPVALSADGAGLVTVTRTYTRDGGATSRISAIGADGGAPRWTHVLPHEGDAYRLARGDGRVLAVWGARTQDYRRELAWAAFDARTGANVGRPQRTRLEIDTGSSEGAAVAYLDDRFVITWTSANRSRRGPMQTMVVRADGSAVAPRTIPMNGDGIPDMVAAGARGALVTSRRGRIEWALLDPDGVVVAGPEVVSAGVGGRDNRAPRVAWDGRVFAVAWETHPDAAVYVAAVDERGRASPALRLDHGDPYAGTIGIAATGTGTFHASYTRDREAATLVALRCRSAPSAGAPQLIAP